MARVKNKRNKQQHKVWNVAVYIRLSRDDGNDESLSVTNQRKIIQEYLENTFEGEYTIVGEYVDDGLSGTTDYERLAFQRMIQGVESGVVNCIVCKTLARTFRIYADQGSFLERIYLLYGDRFIGYADRPIHTSLQ